MDYESSSEGTLLKILLAEGGQAKVGDVIAILGKPGEDITAILADRGASSVGGGATAAPAAAHPAAAAPAPRARRHLPRPRLPAPAAVAPLTGGRTRSSPLARKLAAQKGIDIRTLRGSGPEGRIVKRDVEGAPAGGFAAGGAAAAAAGAARPAQAPLQPGPGDELVPLSRMRQVIARRLSDSMYTAPHFYLTVAVAVDELLAARTRLNAGREKKLSLNAFLMAIAGRALARHPAGQLHLERGQPDPPLARGHRPGSGAARRASSPPWSATAPARASAPSTRSSPPLSSWPARASSPPSSTRERHSRSAISAWQASTSSPRSSTRRAPPFSPWARRARNRGGRE